MSPSVERVERALRAAGIDSPIVELPGAAHTAKLAAQFLGCELGQIANSLVFRAKPSDTAILVMSSGARRVDMGKLAAVVGEEIGKADAEFVRAATGLAIGGVAPVATRGRCARTSSARSRRGPRSGRPRDIPARCSASPTESWSASPAGARWMWRRSVIPAPRSR